MKESYEKQRCWKGQESDFTNKLYINWLNNIVICVRDGHITVTGYVEYTERLSHSCFRSERLKSCILN